MSEWLSPPGWQAIFTGVGGFFAGVAVGMAYLQLRSIARPAQLEGLRQLYSYFDETEARARRRQIHAAIKGDQSDPSPQSLDWETWDAIERTATSLDVVGQMLVKGLIEEELLMERYLEVVIPLWRKMAPYIEFRRGQKGGGWKYFEILFTRAERYKKKHYPKREFQSFTPPPESLKVPVLEGSESRPDASLLGLIRRRLGLGDTKSFSVL